MTAARWALALTATLLASPAIAQDAAPLIAVVNATVHPGDGPPVENATVVVRGGRVVSVSANGPVPAGATRIDAGGGVVTPGFVATQAPLGLVEISLEPETLDLAPESETADAVRAAFSAADGLNPRSTLIPVARMDGVTSALSTPVAGLVSGTSAWIDLAAEPQAADLIVRERAAMHVNLDDSGVAAAGGAMPSALMRLREVLEDARLYGRQRAAYDRRALREMDTSRLDLERLQDVLAGRIPVVVCVSRASDILRVLELSREYRLRLVLAGAEEAWRVADRVAAADVPVIVQPMTNLPSSFTRLGARFDNAAILARAGVRVVITTDGAHDLRNLRQEAGNAVAHGLPADVALRALTLEPARVFGLDADYGTIAPGKVANLVVWNGDPFETTTWATHVIVRGRELPVRSRQTDLLDRYRSLDAIPRGTPGLVPPREFTRVD